MSGPGTCARGLEWASFLQRLPAGSVDRERTSAWSIRVRCPLMIPGWAGDTAHTASCSAMLVRASDEPRSHEIRDADDLTAEDDGVHIDRRLPSHRPILEDPCSRRLRTQTKPRSLTFPVFRISTVAASASAHHAYRRHNDESVLFDRVSVDETSGEPILDVVDKLHRSSPWVAYSRQGAILGNAPVMTTDANCWVFT